MAQYRYLGPVFGVIFRRRSLLARLLAVALTGAPAQLAAQELSVEPYLLVSNGGDTVHAEFGRFEVPENRTRVDTDSLELAFVRFATTSPNPGPPIVYLAGGPGGSGIATARGSRFPLFMALREFGDVIAFDQRGTGMSGGPSPADCPIGRSYPASQPLTENGLRDLTLEVARECAAFWREHGTDLSAYNTEESADDLAALADALGVAKLRLWAISYGTHLALSTIRRHPTTIERAILAGVEGPDHTIKLPGQWRGQLERLQALIDAEPDLEEEFSDIHGLISGVLNRLDREPVPVEMISGDLADTVRTTVSSFAVRMRTIDLLRDPPSMVRVPYLYRRMASGDFSPLAGGSGAGGMSAMPEATDAASGISSERMTRFRREASTTLLGGGDELTNAYMAEALGIPDLGEGFRKLVQSDIPLLFISGTLDGRTPETNATEVLGGFPNGHHLVIDNAGHSDDLFLSSPDILEVMRAFLADRPLPHLRLAVDPPRLSEGRLPPSLSSEFMDAIEGGYARGPADVWRVVRQGTVRSLDAEGRETGRTTSLGVRIRGNGFPLAANADTTFSIPVFGPDVRFRFVRDGEGRVYRLDFTNSVGETSSLEPVRWDDVAFVEGDLWLLAGPFQLEAGDMCERPFPVEREFVEGGAVRPESEGWSPGTGDDGFVDFEDAFGGAIAGGVGYAYLSLMTDAEMSAELRLGSDDDARIFLGPELVHVFDGARAAWEEQDRVAVDLRAGANPLLVKVCNRDSDWRFNLRITDHEGRSLVRETGRGVVRLAPVTSP